MKIVIKTEDQIAKMRIGGKILAKILKELTQISVPGVTTMYLENEAVKLLEENHVKSPFLNYEGYPYNTCMSVNDVIEHGFPNEKVVLKKGDLLKIDMGVIYEGMITDHCVCVIVGGETTKVRQNLYNCSKIALEAAIKDLKEGVDLATISQKITDSAEIFGFSPVRELVGHGVGVKLHEDPSISCYAPQAIHLPLKQNMTIAIETMINEKNWKLKTDKDGWTLRTVDGGDSCMFEHTVLIQKNGVEVLTLA